MHGTKETTYGLVKQTRDLEHGNLINHTNIFHASRQDLEKLLATNHTKEV